jgi:hypothetical protein
MIPLVAPTELEPVLADVAAEVKRQAGADVLVVE